jgi:hypothetical protein
MAKNINPAREETLLHGMNVPGWIQNPPFSSFELLVACGVLLLLVGLLIGLRRRQRVALDRSLLTE